MLHQRGTQLNVFIRGDTLPETHRETENVVREMEAGVVHIFELKKPKVATHIS